MKWSSAEYGNICTGSLDFVKECGAFILEQNRNFDLNKVEVKSLNQLVSYVDKNAEEMLVERLSNLLPEAGFITEEGTINKSSDELNWIIDPLDGTTNFVHQLPVYSISVGLKHGDEMVIGIVYDICRKEMFYASHGNGAYANDSRIRVSQASDLSKTLLATGFPYYDFKKMPQYLQALDFLMKNTHGLRRMGSAAIDLAYTACGRFDGFFEYGLNPWDVAGGICLIQEAGGKVSDFNGEKDYIFGKSIIAANPHIFNEFAAKLRFYFDQE